MSFYYPAQERGVPNGKPGLYPNPAAVPGAPLVAGPTGLPAGIGAPAGYTAAHMRFAQSQQSALAEQQAAMRQGSVSAMPQPNSSGLSSGLPAHQPGLNPNRLAQGPAGSPYGIPISASYGGYPSSSLGSYLAMSPMGMQQPTTIGMGGPPGGTGLSHSAATYTGAPFISTSYASSMPGMQPMPGAPVYSSPNINPGTGVLGAYPSYVSVNPMAAANMSQYPGYSLAPASSPYASMPGPGQGSMASPKGEPPLQPMQPGLGVAGPYPGAPSTARYIRPSYP